MYKFGNIYLEYSRGGTSVFRKNRVIFYAMRAFASKNSRFHESVKIDPARRDDQVIANDFFVSTMSRVLRFARLLWGPRPVPEFLHDGQFSV